MPAQNPGAGATFTEGFWVMTGPQGDATTYGGDCLQFKCNAALNVGDAVYLQAANQVDKGVTANNALRVGIVVGGFSTKYRCFPEVKLGSAASSAAGQIVLVCVSGKMQATSGGAIAVGDKLAFGAVAGQLITTVSASGVILGMALTAAGGAGVAVDVMVSPG